MREDRKRSRRSPVDENSKKRRAGNDRRRKDDSEHRDNRRRSSKAVKSEAPDVKPKVENVSPIKKSNEVITEELKNKEILYQAKMAIQERLRKLNLPNASTVPSSSMKNASVLKPEEASLFVDLQMDKMSRLNELKNRISSTKGLTAGNVVKTPTVVLDSISIEKPKVKQESQPIRQHDSDLIEYLDPRVHLKNSARPRRATFYFKVKGECEKQAHQMRSKAKLEILQSEISRAAKQTGISSAVKLAIVTPSGTESIDNYIPYVEWWDEIVLGNGKGYGDIPPLDQNPQSRYSESITELGNFSDMRGNQSSFPFNGTCCYNPLQLFFPNTGITVLEHPIQLKPPDEPMQPQYIKACLTKKEQKKLRRQNRREVLKERTEKVRLGLEKAPEPKLKISNLMRVLGSDAIQDPTKMEAHVRKQIAERLQRHAVDNEERKLTREQKSAKMIRKMAEDTSLAVHVSVYKIKSLFNPAKKFKVHMNAKQLQMTGIILMLEDINVVVMEGGPKQQKFFKNLMLKRIKWSDEIAGQKKESGRIKEEDGERNECVLIWEGIVQKRAFGEPRFFPANNHKHAREVLDKVGVPHYWDLCYSTSVLLSNDE